MKITKTLPDKISHFLQPSNPEKLEKLVEENNNYASYDIVTDFQSRTVLTTLRDVPAMLQDPIIKSSLSCVMNTTFQTDNNNNVFRTISPVSSVQKELDNFHDNINAQSLALNIGYNICLWGQIPCKHVFNDKNVLEYVQLIPDFTKITPVIISGKTIGYMCDKNFYPSYTFTYAQNSYYKNLGGNVGNRYVTISSVGGDNDETTFQNEFTYADSYLSTASKAWRNINIIEDALLLNRMDQSNYYRLLCVNVGGQVYSKSAIRVLNFYRNLFKKVRRVSYDSSGMSSKGNGQNFEVVIPQTQNQGVDIKNIGGEVDVKALRDLDTQYNRLFAALQIQPSMIGFSSDVPSSLGDSTATSWDKRFARVCKSVSFATFDALHNIDYLHLRSLGYDVDYNDWHYSTVSLSAQDDTDKGEALKIAINNLKTVTDVFSNMNIDYDKAYLVKSMLEGCLSSYGISTDALLSKSDKEAVRTINSDYRDALLQKDADVLVMNGIFKKNEAKVILSSLGEDGKQSIQETHSPVTLSQLTSSVAVQGDTKMSLKDFVIPLDKSESEIKSELSQKKCKFTKDDSVPITFPVYCSNDINLLVSDIEGGAVHAIKNLIIDSGKLIFTNKADLADYLYLYINQSKEIYCENITRSN